MKEFEPPPFICHRAVAAGDRIDVPCPACGHLNSLHVGCEACPVCELLALRDKLTEMTTAGYWQKQARVHGMRWPY
jgi:hypothetical protein